MIWLKESSSQYKGFILKVNTQDTRLNNIEEVKKRLAKQGFETGIVVGEHILTQLEEKTNILNIIMVGLKFLGKSKTIKKELAIANVAKLVSFLVNIMKIT